MFSGDDEEFEMWKQLVSLWLHDNSLKEDKLSARIVNSQKVASVIQLMLQVPMDKLKTKQGVQMIMDLMEKTYSKDERLLAWQAFAEFLVTVRKDDEKAVDFVRRLESAFRKVQGYDSEVQINDRTLAMIALLRLDLSDTDRALIVSNPICAEDFSPKKVIRAIQNTFTKDPQPISKQAKPNKAVENTFMSADDDEDEIHHRLHS